MQVTVLLFGPEAALAKRDSISIKLTGGAATCKDVLSHIAEQWPVLRPATASARLAVNHTFAAPDTPVLATDELALIGPVSGG